MNVTNVLRRVLTAAPAPSDPALGVALEALPESLSLPRPTLLHDPEQAFELLVGRVVPLLAHERKHPVVVRDFVRRNPLAHVAVVVEQNSDAIPGCQFAPPGSMERDSGSISGAGS